MAITGWSGLWNGLVSGVSGAAPNTGYAFNDTPGAMKTRKLAKSLRTRAGVVVGGAELAMTGETYKRGVAPTDSQTNVTALGGARVIESVTPVTLTAADFKAGLVVDSQPDTYPTDLSGNGGGGKVNNGRSVI